jgi:hypothetical protein
LQIADDNILAKKKSDRNINIVFRTNIFSSNYAVSGFWTKCRRREENRELRLNHGKQQQGITIENQRNIKKRKKEHNNWSPS